VRRAGGGIGGIGGRRLGGTLALVIISGFSAAVAGLVGPAEAAGSEANTVVTHGPDWVGARSVTYCVEDGQPLAMTLFAPLADHPVPAVLQVHGGGWHEGSRITDLAASLTATDLVRAGFVVASIDYRLAPANPWPDQVIDVACAVRFLRVHASDLGIDSNRIAAWGDSAGGQLVSLLGTAGATTSWNRGPYPNTSSRVEAVVDEFGPVDLDATDWPHTSAVMIRSIFGAWPDGTNRVLQAASPADAVASGDPPFLILQGTDDAVVPVSQSEILAQRLREARVPVDLVLVERGRHGLATPGEDPSAGEISQLITSFLARTLHQ
jgi:acetyl esterase/lipase